MQHTNQKNTADPPNSEHRFSNFHFSGKVITCSVLFGFGLLLIGAILIVIDSGDEDKGNLTEDSNQIKAPMSVIGPVIMGIGGFTVLVGVLMCLFETKVLRKKNDDSRPLINPQQGVADASLPGTNDTKSTPLNGTKKHRQEARTEIQMNSSVDLSPDDTKATTGSKIIAVSNEFLTPPNSSVNNAFAFGQSPEDGENAFFKSIAISSGASYSGEFQTPSTSYESVETPFRIERARLAIIDDPIAPGELSSGLTFPTPVSVTSQSARMVDESPVKVDIDTDSYEANKKFNASIPTMEGLQHAKDVDVKIDEIVQPDEASKEILQEISPLRSDDGGVEDSPQSREDARSNDDLQVNGIATTSLIDHQTSTSTPKEDHLEKHEAKDVANM